jgi:hypothetical protein
VSLGKVRLLDLWREIQREGHGVLCFFSLTWHLPYWKIVGLSTETTFPRRNQKLTGSLHR